MAAGTTAASGLPPRRRAARLRRAGAAPRSGGYQRQGIGEAVAKSFIRSIASSLGRILAKTLTGRMR